MPRHKTKTVILPKLPNCDLCGRPATHDSYLPEHRTWGYTCEEDFQKHGSTGGFRLKAEGAEE
jgi:hypothetical protein